ncbi:hypothetical protein, partial [Parasediminibacterium sp. JCM 36343]|uniref:hypothetical protein n=1 Tax=Parasediminibacterium sp. JCM 36343 TaxID=3374279 RepID=UPI00397A7173
LLITPVVSYSQDTASLRKEISALLKKYGISNAGFELKVNSNNQKGGQTAFVITNNYNYTVVNDIPMYAKYGILGLEVNSNAVMIPAVKTGLPLYMSNIVKGAGVEIFTTDNALNYCDSVITKYPNFPYGHFCMFVILQHRNPDSSDWIKYAKQAIALFEITTKLELHNPDHDVILAQIKQNLEANNIKY